MPVRDTLLLHVKKLLWIILLPLIFATQATAQNKQPKEEDFYPIQNVPIPEGIQLEVGGMALLPDDKLAVCTRRGEVWIISNPYGKDGLPQYRLFAQGLHEPLGLTYYKGDLYVAQRPELTRLSDTNGDGVADTYKTIYTFHLTGSYHEYAYGPVFDSSGNMIVTLNLGWFKGEKGGYMGSKIPWRGWMLKISPSGSMIPLAAGLRSPAAITIDKAGHIFYAENQGEWVGSGHITEVEQGDFLGHPSSLAWSSLPGSPVKLKVEDIPDSGRPEFEVAKDIPGLKTPSVWIPHAIIGVSTSGILINDNNQMGPFKGQFFVGDQGQSLVNRVFLEKVKGVYQGAVFPFRKGFSSGVLRLCWGTDGSMFVGMTARGWGSTGGGLFGLQRVIWNGKMPFEIRSIHAEPDGFTLSFTQPVDKITAREAASYHLTNFTYQYHSQYGSPIINKADCPLKAIEVSPDGMKVRLVVDSLRQGYIHEIAAPGIRSADESPLLHNVGYYTLNRIPDGDTLRITPQNRVKIKVAATTTGDEAAQLAVKRPAKNTGAGTVSKSADLTYSEIRPLLVKYTCLSCHDPVKRLVGPPYTLVAKRHYAVDSMIQLIHHPEPEHWPDYATPMPPIQNIPLADLKKIANWINALDK